MSANSNSWSPLRRTVGILSIFLLLAALFLTSPSGSFARSEVYEALPIDTRVITYSLGDYDGNGTKELAVLYTSKDDVLLTLFIGDMGRWSRWRDVGGPLALSDTNLPRSMESVDTTGDGRAEIFIYYITEKNTAMTARIFSIDGLEGPHPSLSLLLEDTTSPAGYPLLGTEDQAPSVTFLRMATGKANGYRRVYCWKGEAFEICEEVVWERP